MNCLLLEVFYILGYDVMYSVESQRAMLPASCCFLTWPFFDSEDGGELILQNVG
jgi:hypothetical protein